MTAPVFADALGPRARRRVTIATVVASIAVVFLLLVALRRFSARDQLAWERWEPFTQWNIIRFLLGGLVNTLRAALTAMALAFTLGALLAAGRLAQTAPVRWLAGAYVHFFRAMPVLLLMLFSSQSLPQLGIHLDAFGYVVIALVAYNSAVLCEILRAGILSLDRGQTEAADAVGLTYWQTMRLVLLPQAVRRMVPAIVSQLVTLLKDTALGSIISYEELLRRGKLAGGAFGERYLQSLIVVAAMYVVVCFTLSRLAHRLEIRQRRRYQAASAHVAGVEDLALVDAKGAAAT